MREPTKIVKKELWKLNELAYQRELSAALEKLIRELAAWKNGKKEIFDVVQYIHEFHDGTARDLYKRYVLLRNPLATVSMALEEGVLDRAEITEEVGKFLGLTAELR